MNQNLRSRTIRALFWSFGERSGYQLTQFLVSLALTRLLFPADFGLLAILMVFIAVANNFVDGGFSAALIQKKEITGTDECSVFYFNIVLGLLLAAIIFAVSPSIADFYGHPVLAPLAQVLCLKVVIGSFGSVHIALLTRQVNFAKLTMVSLIAVISSGSLGIAMALSGYGVWSLVIQSVANSAIHTTLLWVLNDWRPARTFSVGSLQSMFPFGSRLLLSGLLNNIFDNLYSLVIGKLFPASALGFYNRAEFLQKIPVTSLSMAVGRVTFPVFSSLQEDIPRLKKGLRKALAILALINFPMMIGLAVLAEPLVLFLLTEKWLPSVPYLQLFCAVGFMHPVHAINLSALKALGRSDLFLRLEILKKVLIVVSIAITYRFGIATMITGAIVVSVIGYYLNSYYTGRLVGYPITQQLRDLIPTVAAASSMGLVLLGVQYSLATLDPVWQLALQLPLGLVLFVGFCRLLRVEVFLEGWRTILANR